VVAGLFLDKALRRWLAVLGIAVASLILGYLGLHDYLALGKVPGYGRGWPDLLFYDIQLFLLNAAPASGPGPFPVALGIARFLAPATTVVATVETVRLLLHEQLRRWSSASASRHAIVTGDGPIAVELARQLRAEYRKVVLVSATPAPAGQVRAHRLLDVVGDPTDAGTLRAAGLRRAEVLYACAELSTTNAATALRAREMTQAHGGRLSAFAQVRDVEISTALRARRIGANDDGRFRLDFFSVEDTAARVLLDKHPVAPGGAPPARVVIVGFGRLGRAVLRETSRRPHPGGSPLRVNVRGTEPEALSDFLDLFPVVGRNCIVSCDDEAPAGGNEPTLTIVCLPDNDDALNAGLAAARAMTTRTDRVVICMSEPSPFGAVLTSPQALLGDAEGRLAVFEVIQEASAPGRIREDDLADQLARAIHAAYVNNCLARGDSPLTNRSMRPWEDLPEDLRQSNRAQAADIGAKLETIDCIVVPESAAVPGFTFSASEIDQLAKLEHERWVKERTDQGYVHGPVREAKQHPDLVDWQYLSETAQDKDRDAIRELPAVLSQAGFQLLRLPPRASRPDGGAGGKLQVGLLSSAPAGGRPLVRRAVAAGAACVAAAGSGVAAVEAGVAVSVSLAVSLGVLAVAMVALEGPAAVHRRLSRDRSPKPEPAAGTQRPAIGGGPAGEVPVRAHPPAYERSEERVAARPEPGPGDRYLVGRVKEEVEAGREFFLSLQVKVTQPKPAAGVSQAHLRVDRPGDLLAVLVADPIFSLLTADKIIVPVPREGEGAEKGFTLRARRPGVGWLRVDVHRGTQALTTFRFSVTASEVRTESETRFAIIGIPQTAAPPGVMKILLTGRKERTIQLVVGETYLEDHPLEIGQSALREQLQKITVQLNEFSDSTARGSITRKRGELHGLGKQIYRSLLPGPFVEEFRTHRPSAASLAIQGSSPLPWELMADSDDDTFLAEELRVTRWLNGSQPGAPIRLGHAIFACTEGVDGAGTEIKEIGKLLCPGQKPAIIAESVQLYQRMRAGDFDLFHFAGHTKEDKSPEMTALDFGNDDDFTLNYMANVPAETLRSSRPVIFLNACGSASGLGRQTLFDHWAEMFINRGAGAFIGSLWNIRSETANSFGTDVYRSIREGAASTLGEAVDFARRSSDGDPSDPTRLAYALYGSDNAQVILNP